MSLVTQLQVELPMPTKVDYRINLTGAFPVDIRVSRVTADSTSSSLIDSFLWTSLGEIIDDASTYANSAYASVRLDSMQFQSIPSRKLSWSEGVKT